MRQTKIKTLKNFRFNDELPHNPEYDHLSLDSTIYSALYVTPACKPQLWLAVFLKLTGNVCPQGCLL